MVHPDAGSGQHALARISLCALAIRHTGRENPVKIRVFSQCLLQNISGLCYDLEAQGNSAPATARCFHAAPSEPRVISTGSLADSRIYQDSTP